ncbi:MAG: flagellin [Hungatella sp.]|nr:flagellin [Hungatella sp.]
MRIQHNIAALNSYRQLGSNNDSVSKNLEKLSSGYRINRAGDDAAGLAISEKMRAQITGLETASKNANDGISLVQTAEGALTEVHSMLNRMVELADQSANGTQQDAVDRENIQKEVNSLKSEIDRISESTNFNGINLLDGSLGGGKSGTAGVTSFTGAGVAKFTAASTAGMSSITDFTNTTMVSLGDSTKDTFSVDGQTLTIDWSKGDAKTIADTLKTLNGSGAGAALTETTMKDMATKLNNLFNGAIEEQGLKGSVKFTFDGETLVAASTDEGSKSEFSFTGTDAPANGNVTSFGAAIFGNVTANGDAAKISQAGSKYNGESLATNSQFLMNINGVKVTVETDKIITKGQNMSGTGGVADTLQTAVKAAVLKYNTTNGLTAGQKDAESGLTGLKDDDFTVEANTDGQFVVKYSGDVENTAFSFSDVGDKTVATSLGLSSGSSVAGGGRGLNLQIGDTADSFNQLTVRVDSMSSKSLGINGIDVGTQAGAKQAVDVIKAAINKVSSTRGDLGAAQNRLEHTISNLNVTTENMTAAESRIRDVDMAKEMMNYTKNNILVQASQSMLAQANQTPQGVLQLLK